MRRITAFDLFCEENYVAAWREARQAEEERRAEAFFDVARPVAGIPLRPLTPQDLHTLDSFRSPFVVGDPADATAEHIIAVLWMLRYHAGRWPALGFWVFRRRLLRRWRRDPARLVEDHAALTCWFEDVFADAGAPRSPGTAPGARSPVGVHFLAALLVSLCAELGPIDPATGCPLAQVPLARLFQYQKMLRLKIEGERFVDFNSADAVKSQALEAWNSLPAEEKAAWQAQADELNAAPAPASDPASEPPAP